MVGIIANGIETYCFNVSFMFLVIFLLILWTAHLFEVVHLVAFFTLPPLCQASSQFVDLTAVFASCGNFTGVTSLISVYLHLFVVLHHSSLPHANC